MAVSFRDESLTQLARAEAPDDFTYNMLQAIRLAGERSNSDQVSPAGARGVYQFMPTTFSKFADEGADPTDPAAATRAAVRYIEYARKQYGDNPAAIAAEYNGGPRQANAVLKSGDALANETRAYIPRVLKHLSDNGINSRDTNDDARMTGKGDGFSNDYFIDAAPTGKPKTRAIISSDGFSNDYFMPDASPAAAPETFMGAATRGIKKTIPELQQAGYGVAAYFGDVFGAQGVKDWGLEKYKNIEESTKSLQSENDSFSKVVIDGEGSIKSWLGNAVGYTIGQVGSAIVSGGIGGMVGKALAKKGITQLVEQQIAASLEKNLAAGMTQEAAKTAALDVGQKVAAGALIAGRNTGAFTGALLHNETQELGSIYNDAVEQAKKEGRSLDSGDLFRIGASSLAAAGVDTAMEAVNFNKLTKGGSGSTIARRAALEIPSGMAREGFTEAVQTGIEQYGAGKPLDTREIIDSAALGAVGGGMAGAGASLHSRTASTVPIDEAADAPITPVVTPDQIRALPSPNMPAGNGVMVQGPDGVRPQTFGEVTTAEQTRRAADDAAAERARLGLGESQRIQATSAERQSQLAEQQAQQEQERIAATPALPSPDMPSTNGVLVQDQSGLRPQTYGESVAVEQARIQSDQVAAQRAQLGTDNIQRIPQAALEGIVRAGPEPAPAPMLASSGKPFATEKSALVSIQSRKLTGYEAVPVMGGYGIQLKAKNAELSVQPVRGDGSLVGNGANFASGGERVSVGGNNANIPGQSQASAIDGAVNPLAVPVANAPLSPYATLTQAIRKMGGLSAKTARDITGNAWHYANKQPGYKDLFNEKGTDLSTLVHDGKLDAFLPPAMRSDVRDDSKPTDTDEAIAYIENLLRTGEGAQTKMYVKAEAAQQRAIVADQKQQIVTPIGESLSVAAINEAEYDHFKRTGESGFGWMGPNPALSEALDAATIEQIDAALDQPFNTDERAGMRALGFTDEEITATLGPDTTASADAVAQPQEQSSANESPVASGEAQPTGEVAPAQENARKSKLADGIRDENRVINPDYYSSGYPWENNWEQVSGSSIAQNGSDILNGFDRYNGEGMKLRDAIRHAEIIGDAVPDSAYARLKSLSKAKNNDAPSPLEAAAKALESAAVAVRAMASPQAAPSAKVNDETIADDMRGRAWALVKNGNVVRSGSLPAPQYSPEGPDTKASYYRDMADQQGADLYIGGYPASDASPLPGTIFGMTWEQLNAKQQRNANRADLPKGKMPSNAVLAYSPSDRPALDLTSQSEAEIKADEAKKSRDTAAKTAQDNAPSPEGFTLTGSDRAADVGAAAGQDAMFKRADDSSQSRFTHEEAISIAAELKAAGMTGINVVRSVADMPETERNAVLARSPDGEIRGAYFKGNNGVWLVTDNIRTPEEFMFTALHEGFHRGLANTIGGNAKQLLLSMFASNANLREQTRAQMERHGIGQDEAIEEALADMAGTGEVRDLKGWDKLVGLLRSWLGKLADSVGLKINWTDDMIADFVAGIRRNGLTDGVHMLDASSTVESMANDKPLTAAKFESGYFQHIDVRGRSGGTQEQTLSSIMKDGFKAQYLNALPVTRGTPHTDVISRNYAPRAGDLVYLVPKASVKDNKVLPGWKPQPYEAIRVTSDNPDMYAEYLAAFKKANEQSAPKVVDMKEGGARSAINALSDRAGYEGVQRTATPERPVKVEPASMDGAAASEAKRSTFDQVVKDFAASIPINRSENESEVQRIAGEISADWSNGNVDEHTRTDGPAEAFAAMEKEKGDYYDADGDLTEAGSKRFTELTDAHAQRLATDIVGPAERRAVDLTDPRDAASVLHAYLNANGVDTNIVGGSGKSRSKYFTILKTGEELRISDHELPGHYENNSSIDLLIPSDPDEARAYLKNAADNIIGRIANELTTSQDGDVAFSHKPDTITVDGKERSRLNSNGKPIAATDEGIRNFWKWFGDSKVVDGQGRPVVVYHGGVVEGDGGISTFHQGTHFGTKEQASDAQGESLLRVIARKDPTRNQNTLDSTYAAYLRIENPTRKPDLEDGWNHTIHSVKRDDPTVDGIVYRNRYEGDQKSDSYIIFDGKQVKSATGNNGQFSPDNADIRFSRTTTVGDNNRPGGIFDRNQSLAQSAYSGAEAVQGLGNGVKSILKSTANMARDKRGAALQFLGGRQIADIYTKDVPELPQYNERLQIMQAEQNEGSAVADAIIDKWRVINRKRPDVAQRLSGLMHDATLAQIDPDKSTEDQALRQRWINLPQEAKEIYREARDAYVTHFEKVKAELMDRVQRSGLDTSAKERALRSMREEFTKAMKGVYFPLARFGEYMVIVKDAAGVTKSVNMAESTNQAQQMRADLIRAYPNDIVGAVQKKKEFNAERDGVSRGFMKDLVSLINEEPDADTRNSQLDAINQLWLSSLPDLSWAKSGIHRKGTPGYSNDAMRAFARNMFHGGYHLAKLKHGDRLSDSLAQMQETIDDKVRSDPNYSNVVAQSVVDEMNQRHRFVMNPQNTPLANTLTGLGFMWHMGLSPASAVVNLSQTALVAYPMLASKFGFTKAAGMLLSLSAVTLEGKNDLLSQLKGAEREAYDRAVKEGLIDLTMAHDLAGVSQGKSGAFNENQQRVMRVASMMFHEAEKFNRGVTFMAAYRMATQAGVSDPYKLAHDLTFDSHFDYSATNRPRIMQGPTARVVLLFKQYGQNMIYTLARNTAKALQGDREAMKTLGGLLAMHGMFAGALGLPLMTTLLAAASAIGGSEDEPWDAQVALRNYLAETFGKEMGEVLSHGVFRAPGIKDMIGADISGRVGLDSLLIRMPQETLEGKKYYQALLETIAGPVFGIGGNIAGGMQTMSQGNTLRGIEEMLPKSIKDPLKAYRYDQEGIQDKSGISIIDETTVPEEVAQFLGFSSARGMEGFEGKGAIKDQETHLTQRRRQLMQRYGRDREDGDTTDSQAAIQLWNRANPTMVIRGDDLIRSIREKARRQAEAENGVYLTKKRRDLASLGDFAGTE